MRRRETTPFLPHRPRFANRKRKVRILHSAFLKWLTSEPVRTYLYPVIVALLALLVVLGVLSGGLVPYVLAVVVAVLGPVSTELVRSAVSPASPPQPPTE